MAPSLVQTRKTGVFSNTAFTPAALTTQPTAGSLLILVIALSKGSATVPTVTAPAGWSHIITQGGAANTTLSGALAVLGRIATGVSGAGTGTGTSNTGGDDPPTVSITGSGASNIVYCLEEWPGSGSGNIDTTSFPDVAAAVVTGTSTSGITGSALTVTGSNEWAYVAYGGRAALSGSAITWGGSLAAECPVTGTGGPQIATATQTVSAATITPSPTFTNAQGGPVNGIGSFAFKTLVISGTITLAGAGTLVLTGVPSFPGSVALAGAGTLALTAAPGWAAIVPLSGAGALLLTAAPGMSGTVILAGAGALSLLGNAGFTGTVLLTGQGALALTGAAGFAGTITLAGGGTLALTGAPGWAGTVTTSGVGTLALTGVSVAAGTLPLAGSGALNLTGAPAVPGTVATAGTGTLSLTGSPAVPGTVLLGGAGALNLAGHPAFTGAVLLGGSGALNLTGAAAAAGAVALAGSGSLSLGGTPQAAGTVALSGSGGLNLGGAPQVAGTVALAGAGALSFTAAPAVAGQLTLAGAGALLLTAAPRVGGTVALAGDGQIALNAAPGWVGVVALSGSGLLVVRRTRLPQDITLTFRPLPDRWGFAELPGRYRFTPLPSRWLFQEEPMDVINLAEGGAGYLGGIYTAQPDILGNTPDISADTVMLTVGTERASGGHWQALTSPHVLQPVPGRTDQLLVKLFVSPQGYSPQGYTPPVPANPEADQFLWGKLTDAPETDARKLCRVEITYPV